MCPVLFYVTFSHFGSYFWINRTTVLEGEFNAVVIRKSWVPRATVMVMRSPIVRCRAPLRANNQKQDIPFLRTRYSWPLDFMLSMLLKVPLPRECLFDAREQLWLFLHTVFAFFFLCLKRSSVAAFCISGINILFDVIHDQTILNSLFAFFWRIPAATNLLLSSSTYLLHYRMLPTFYQFGSARRKSVPRPI